MFTKCSIYFDSPLGDHGEFMHVLDAATGRRKSPKKIQVKKSSTHPSVQLSKLHTYLHREEYTKYTSVEQMVYVCIYIYTFIHNTHRNIVNAFCVRFSFLVNETGRFYC